MKLNDVAVRDVITIGLGESADKAIALMEEHDIHHLPVVDGDRPVGMVSDRDLLASVGWLTSHERTDVHDGTLVGPRGIQDIMSQPVLTSSPDEPVADATRLMLREHIGALPLVREGKLVALVTEADLLRCFFDDHLKWGSTKWRFDKVENHMSAQVYSLKANDPILRATRLMKEKHVRHIPVVEEERLVGIVSDRDIRQALFRHEMEWYKDEEPPERLRVNLRDVMSDHPLWVKLHTTLAEAASLMINARIHALPVVNDHRLSGIITQTDLLRALLHAEDSLNIRVADE